MTVLRPLYPYALASLNLGFGWLVYHTFGDALGVLLLIAGLLVSVTVVYRTAARLAVGLRGTPVDG